MVLGFYIVVFSNEFSLKTICTDKKLNSIFDFKVVFSDGLKLILSYDIKNIYDYIFIIVSYC